MASIYERFLLKYGYNGRPLERFLLKYGYNGRPLEIETGDHRTYVDDVLKSCPIYDKIRDQIIFEILPDTSQCQDNKTTYYYKGLYVNADIEEHACNAFLGFLISMIGSYICPTKALSTKIRCLPGHTAIADRIEVEESFRKSRSLRV